MIPVDKIRKSISINGTSYDFFNIRVLEKEGMCDIKRLPFSIRILVENLLRKLDGEIVSEEDLRNIAYWQKRYETPVEIPWHPARVLMQDFTGVPAVVDLAAMRDAVQNLGGDPRRINPMIPVDLVVDHSIQVDFYGTTDCLKRNVDFEYKRNSERYSLLKWAQKSFDNFRVVPPNSGICHQVNLEYISKVVITEDADGRHLIYPDTLVGTDSHTTMVNSIGVMGWGVGGIEAEAVMLGQPYYMTIPEVVGVRLTGNLKEGVTATDLVLTITERLRQHNVVEKFVEYTGPGVHHLTIPDRATIANMSPEYGATMGFFPIDEKTIAYLEMTGRKRQAEFAEAYAKSAGLFYNGNETPEYTEIIELDLADVEPSAAGPARPQDRIGINRIESYFSEILGGTYEKEIDVKNISSFLDESGGSLYREAIFTPACALTPDFGLKRSEVKIRDGSVVIAAITSCANTSNPHAMIGAGLLAKKAVEKGIHVSPYVKTSLVPGSKVVVNYLKQSGLMPFLEAQGFHLAGFGCTTCIGNSGPLHSGLEKVIADKKLSVVAVLSGNRNFEARINQSVRANFLMSPMLVVAFALAGRIDIDFLTDPIAVSPNCEPVFLKDIWPADEDIRELVKQHVVPESYEAEYSRIFIGDAFWQELNVNDSTTFDWNETSTYIKNPPYFDNFSPAVSGQNDIEGARALVVLGDSVTTDHISPAGAIPESYPAGQYLKQHYVDPAEFNSYGSRRGNHDVMIRGTFGNIRIRNKLIAPKEGSFTKKFPENTDMFIYNAATAYKAEGVPLIVLAGKEYGTGSSRDWAAKGTCLLGVKVVIAESFERIHRSNLVGMGVLPLEFMNGENIKGLGLEGNETFFITGINDMVPRKKLQVRAVQDSGKAIDFMVTARLDTDIDVAYFEHGGILTYVLRNITAGV